MRIGVVANYFGVPPGFFQLWLDSCAVNGNVEWIFLTDIHARDYAIPQNVRFVSTSMVSLKRQIQKNLGYEIRYGRAWDFCALKSILGCAFVDELKGCDFWGWSDCDMIYGNLSRCVEACSHFDKVLPKGHLSFVRNDERLNSFIAGHPLTHKAIAADESGLPCYDEVGLIEEVLPEFGARQCNDIPFVNTACRPGHFVFDDMAALQQRLGIEGNGSVPFVVTWRDGNMVAHCAMPTGNVCREEVAYFHFFRRNMTCEVERLLPGCNYLIVPNRILAYDGHDPSFEEIRQLDRFCINWRYWTKQVGRRLKRVMGAKS